MWIDFPIAYVWTSNFLELEQNKEEQKIQEKRKTRKN